MKLDTYVAARFVRSDGVELVADGSDWLMQQLQLCAQLGHTPQQAADAVAEAAARRAGEKQDDITVAVLRLAKRPNGPHAAA